jgi:SAM-dependent methyltransferase
MLVRGTRAWTDEQATNIETCQICGLGHFRPYRHGWLRRCSHCRVLRSEFAPDIPSRRSQSLIDEGDREEGLSPVRRINNRRLLRALEAIAPGRRLLDIGCGPGFFLKSAAAWGYQVIGVEPDANTVERARAHAEVRHGYFPEASPPDQDFDVIVMNDVLEHMPDPGAAIDACWRKLRPGGVLVLNCPSRNGVFFRAAAALDRLGVGGPYARLWQKGLPSPHLWYFTPDNLMRAAKIRGLERLFDVRLTSVSLRGLWRRIGYVRGSWLAAKALTFIAVAAVAPVVWALPSDSIATVFRRHAD